MPYIMAVDLGGTNCRFAGFTLDKGILSLHLSLIHISEPTRH